MLQLDEVSLYASGLALLEQNLHTLDSQGIFDNNVSLASLDVIGQSINVCFVVFVS